MVSLQGIPTPIIDWSSTCIDESYENFKETCELIFEGPLSDLDEKRKINYLKLWCGNEGRALIKTWQLSDAESIKLETYWTKFKEYVKPKSNFRVARFKLRACKQEEGEAIDAFVKRLRMILAECKYPADQHNDHLIDAIIFGVQSDRIQTKLLPKDETLTVDDAIKIARTEEATLQQFEELRGKAKNIQVVHSAKTRRNRDKPQAPQIASRDTCKQQSCGRCGLNQHTPSESCPAKASRCSSCHKIGHWHTCCRSVARPKTIQNTGDQHKSHKVHAMEADSDCDSSEEYSMYTLSINTLSSNKEALLNVKFCTADCSQDLRCKIDTGAEANILPLHVAKTIFSDLPSVLMPSSVIITAFGGTRVSQLGTITCTVEKNNKKMEADFFVTDTPGPVILGFETSSLMGIVSLNYELKK